jgi:hypothetical protein
VGRVDYWLRSGRYDNQSYSSKGTLHDWYIGTPLVSTLPEFEAALAAPNRAQWIPVSSTVLADSKAPVAPDLRAYLRGAEQRLVSRRSRWRP